MWGKIKALFGMGDDPELVEARVRMQVDHQDPRKRFVFGILNISYEADPAYLVEHSRTAIVEWYGMESREALLDNLDYYLKGTGSTPGYDAFRAAFMARAGLPAGYLTVDESWQWAIAAAKMAQEAYSAWPHYGSGYLEGHLVYRKDQGDDQASLARYQANITKTIGELSQGIWATTPFDTAL